MSEEKTARERLMEAAREVFGASQGYEAIRHQVETGGENSWITKCAECGKDMQVRVVTCGDCAPRLAGVPGLNWTDDGGIVEECIKWQSDLVGATMDYNIAGPVLRELAMLASLVQDANNRQVETLVPDAETGS